MTPETTRTKIVLLGLILMVGFASPSQATADSIHEGFGPCDGASPIDEIVCEIPPSVEDPFAGDLYSRSPDVAWTGAKCKGAYTAVEVNFVAEWAPDVTLGAISLKSYSVGAEVHATALYWAFSCWANELTLSATAIANTQSVERKVSLQVRDQDSGTWQTYDSCVYRTIEDPQTDSCTVRDTFSNPASETETNGILPTQTLPVSREVCIRPPDDVRAIETTRANIPVIDYPLKSEIVGWDHFGDVCRVLEIEWDDLDADDGGKMLGITPPCLHCLLPDDDPPNPPMRTNLDDFVVCSECHPFDSQDDDARGEDV